MKLWNKIIAASALASLLVSGTASANGSYTTTPYKHQKQAQQPHYQTISTPAPQNTNNLNSGYITPVVSMPNQMPETTPQRSPYQQDIYWPTYPDVMAGFQMALTYIGDTIIEVFYNQLIMEGVMGILQSLMPGWMLGLFDAEAEKSKNINIAAEARRKALLNNRWVNVAPRIHSGDVASQREQSLHLQEKESDILVEQNDPLVTQDFNEQCVRASKTAASLGALGAAENAKAEYSQRLRGRFGGGALKSIQERSCLFYEMVDQENDYGGVLSGLDLQCQDFNIRTLLQNMGLGILANWLSGGGTDDHTLVDTNVTETFFRTRTQDQDGKVALVQAAAMNNLFPDGAQQPIQEKRIEDAMAEDGTFEGRLESNELKEHILEERKLDAKRSIAQNTYIHMMGDSVNYKVDRANGGKGNKTIFNRFGDLMLDETSENDISQTHFGKTLTELKENPSYKAQLELMAKQLYLHPNYIARSASSSEMSKSETLMANAAESIVLYDTLQSALRHEALLATILEVMTGAKQEEVETQARRLNSNN